MFSKSGAVWAFRLSHIFFITIGTGKLVNARFIKVVIILWIMVMTEGFSYGVLCSICNTNISVFKEFRNKPGLLSYICKRGESLWRFFVVSCFVTSCADCVSTGGWMLFSLTVVCICEGILFSIERRYLFEYRMCRTVSCSACLYVPV